MSEKIDNQHEVSPRKLSGATAAGQKRGNAIPFSKKEKRESLDIKFGLVQAFEQSSKH